MSVRTTDLTGCVLDGRYELDRLIGEGAFGRVYRGRDRRLDRAVAVKVIKPWWTEDAAWVELFEREVRLLARVSHPGITQIFDVGDAPEGPYYVTELVDGDSLATRLRRGALSPAPARDIAVQLCRALEHAHARSVLHCDIKPANVLITPTGQVKLSDFGVARLTGASGDPATGLVHGTPRYMSPEQARGRRPTAAADLYSVGVVLYEMLAGAPPFSGDSAVELALCHLHDTPAALPQRTPAALAGVVNRALAKDPALRYPSAQAMAHALARADLGQRSRPGSGSALRLPEVAPPTVRPDPTPVAPGVGPDPTRVAPRMHARRNANPAARRNTVAAFAVAGLVLVGMLVADMLLAAPARVRLPNLSGLSQPGITTTARQLGLRVAFLHRYDSAVDVGRAIGQSPPAGTLLAKGSTVRVVLSSGPPPVEVPRVTGQTSTSARGILSSLNLRTRTVYVPAPGTSPGVVVTQAPSWGEYLPVRSTVTLSVAETPSWRALTTVSGTSGQHSNPFRIRGTEFRIVYQMSYVGTCTWVLFCDSPTAKVVRTSDGSTVSQFDLTDGGTRAQVIRSGPGEYELEVTPGGDTARWSQNVQDYY